MPSKQFALDERLTVTIYKRSSSRSIRLSVAANGQVKVSMPTWLPYKAGLQFAKSRRSWIDEQVKPPHILQPGHAVGKAHHLTFVASDTATRVSSRVVQSDIIIKYPSDLQIEDAEVQSVAQAASLRALRTQAEKLLPQRLDALAAQHHFSYASVSIKRLTSRWGSCDQHTNIVLNLFLMQLPWECIDYVLLHELTHTEHMSHGADFWARMDEVVPKLKYIRKVMRSYQPVLHSHL